MRARSSAWNGTGPGAAPGSSRREHGSSFATAGRVGTVVEVVGAAVVVARSTDVPATSASPPSSPPEHPAATSTTSAVPAHHVRFIAPPRPGRRPSSGRGFHGGREAARAVRPRPRGAPPAVPRLRLERETWAWFRIEDEHVIAFSEDAAALTYRVAAQRPGEPEYRALITSAYVRRGRSWLMALHQQTPC